MPRRKRTFTETVEAAVWADLDSQTRAIHDADLLGYQERALFLTAAIDTAAERLEWLGVPA